MFSLQCGSTHRHMAMLCNALHPMWTQLEYT